MSGLAEFARLIDGDHGLVVVSTLRADGTIQRRAAVLLTPERTRP